jgi:hypothetical protein
MNGLCLDFWYGRHSFSLEIVESLSFRQADDDDAMMVFRSSSSLAGGETKGNDQIAILHFLFCSRRSDSS